MEKGRAGTKMEAYTLEISKMTRGLIERSMSFCNLITLILSLMSSINKGKRLRGMK
jgi:hypothetical protein